MEHRVAIAELESLAYEACEASKKAKTFEQRYQAAQIFAQCQMALYLERIATQLEDGQIAVLDAGKV